MDWDIRLAITGAALGYWGRRSEGLNRGATPRTIQAANQSTPPTSMGKTTSVKPIGTLKIIAAIQNPTPRKKPKMVMRFAQTYIRSIPCLAAMFLLLRGLIVIHFRRYVWFLYCDLEQSRLCVPATSIILLSPTGLSTTIAMPRLYPSPS